MVHVCFGLNDASGRYSKFTGITIMSIFNKINHVGGGCTIHILHDDTVSEKNLQNLRSLGNERDTFVKLYRVDSSSFAAIKGDEFNIGTMYRLAMPEVIPESVSKLIYLDSDIIVNLDLQKLYDMDLKGKSLAALPSIAPGFWVYDAKIVDNYFNNGVMLLDLKKIRSEHNLLKETKEFFDKFNHKPTCDQDSFNYIFRNDYLELPETFNYVTVKLRNKKQESEEVIYHFAGDVPNIAQIETFDRLFFHYWLASPWVDQFQEYFIEAVRLREESLEFLRSLMKNFNKKLVIWGAGSIYLKKVLSYLPTEKIILLDGDKNKQGAMVNNITIMSPEILKEIDSYVVLILSGKYYDEISEKLMEYGLKENIDYFDGSLILSEDDGFRIVPVSKGNLRDLHFRPGSINADPIDLSTSV